MEFTIEHVVSAKMPTEYGDFMIHGYVNQSNGEHHIALVKGKISGEKPVLIRVHSECLTGDALGSARCDCGDQYRAAMELIAKRGQGVLIYLRQEGRGIGLINKLKAYALQDKGMDTVEANIALGFPADLRDYSVGAQILHHLGIEKVELLTNNPEKVSGMERLGIEVVRRIAIETKHKKECEFYMTTKKVKMGHILETYQ